eukprot:TRINITY_DN6781_c0_g1_i1.p1 TRINITY_DN6781_c0_g1~~TRINITY_DN6781_c0_g1_i1.p1  ORF type:complete len:56 (+),score=9.98 TRINITY_DN6781_c0_g1_i1:176-343(+)
MSTTPVAQTLKVESSGGYELVCKFLDNTKARMHNLPLGAMEIAERYGFEFIPGSP